MPGLQAWRATTRRGVPECCRDQVAALADFDFFLVAGLVVLNVFAAALRSAGLFAVFIVFAALLFVSGAPLFAAAALGAAGFFAAGFAGETGVTFFAGALAAFGAAGGLAAAFVALAAGALRAGLAGASALAAFAGLAAARTAMACARGRFVVLSLLMVKAFLDRVAACTSRGTATHGPMPRESLMYQPE